MVVHDYLELFAQPPDHILALARVVVVKDGQMVRSLADLKPHGREVILVEDSDEDSKSPNASNNVGGDTAMLPSEPYKALLVMADSRIAAVEATDAATEPDTRLSSTRTASAVAYVPNAQFRRVVVGELKESMHPSGRKHAVRASIDSSRFSRIRYVIVEQDLDGKSLPIPASTRRSIQNGSIAFLPRYLDVQCYDDNGKDRKALAQEIARASQEEHMADGVSDRLLEATPRASGNGIDTEGPITVSFVFVPLNREKHKAMEAQISRLKPFLYTFKGSDRAEAVRKQVLEEYSKQLVSLKDGTQPPVQFGVRIWLAPQDGHQYRFYDPEFSSVLLYQFLLVSSEKTSDRKLEAQITLKARVTDLASLPTDISEAAYISDEEVPGICSCGEPDEGITIQCDGAKVRQHSYIVAQGIEADVAIV